MRMRTTLLRNLFFIDMLTSEFVLVECKWAESLGVTDYSNVCPAPSVQQCVLPVA
jgi:hypothetical protein